jgi:hypothetical protein
LSGFITSVWSRTLNKDVLHGKITFEEIDRTSLESFNSSEAVGEGDANGAPVADTSVNDGGGV